MTPFQLRRETIRNVRSGIYGTAPWAMRRAPAMSVPPARFRPLKLQRRLIVAKLRVAAGVVPLRNARRRASLNIRLREQILITRRRIAMRRAGIV